MNEFSRYAQSLRRAAASLERKAEAIVDEVGRGALRDAEAYAPILTGELRRGLRYERKGTTATVSSSTFYAPFQEFGTSQMAPNPFIGPAARKGGDRLVEGLERLRDGIARDL